MISSFFSLCSSSFDSLKIPFSDPSILSLIYVSVASSPFVTLIFTAFSLGGSYFQVPTFPSEYAILMGFSYFFLSSVVGTLLTSKVDLTLNN